MGKGKKKKANKGKKKDGKKTEDDTGVSGSSLANGGKKIREDTEPFSDIVSWTLQPSQEQKDIAIAACANRTEDPLKNWTRPQNEECPICMLLLPLRKLETNYCVTCGKTVCLGCMISTGLVHKRDGGDRETAIEKAMTCPYCRSNTEVDDDKFRLEKEMQRANEGNGESMSRIATSYFDGGMGLRQDKDEGLKWYYRALEAGNGLAAYCLGMCYWKGDGIEKDIEKALEYCQKSADLGYIPAFSLIGAILMNKGDIGEGMLNYRKAAICGESNELLFNVLRDGFKYGYITKDEYALTLRENQAACNEMKSDGRDRIKVWLHKRMPS